MSLAHWRQFQFFESTPIQDPYYGSDRALYSEPTLSSIAATSDYLAIVSDNGMVKLISSKFEQLAEWRVEDAGWTVLRLQWINPLKILESKGILITIAERQGQPVSLKLWDLDKLLSRNYNWMKFDHNSSYKSHCSISNVNGGNNYPLTCFDAMDDYSMLAAGFANGALILVSGDLVHDRGTRQRVIYQSTDPVTGIKFKDDSLIYIATINKVFTIATTGKNHGRYERMLDDKAGANINCVDILPRTGKSRDLVVGRNDSIQFYNSKSRTHSIQLEIEKKRIYLYKKGYLLFLTPLASEPTTGASTTAHRLIILDLAHKFVVFNQTFTSPVIEIFELWKDLFMLTSDGVLVKLHELTIKEKVESVIQRELFSIGIKLAYEDANKFTEVELLNLHKLYGEFLYKKEDYKDSIRQFIKCIKLGKTSEVIAKFKESSKIPYLVEYLETMCEFRVSKYDHVTLLLSCYCKLKRNEKILEYIESVRIDEDYDIVEEHQTFDLKTIIRLCRESGDYKLASVISQRFNLPENVVSIQINDLNNPKLAMDYIQTLKIDDLLRVLVEHVSQLLDIIPYQTTKLLIEVFTGHYSARPSLDTNAIAQPKDSNDKTANLESNPLLTSYQQFVTFMKLSSYKEAEEKEVLEESYQPPKPKIIFSSFAKHNYEFVIFLEACIESYDKFQGKEEDKKEIITTLYEMYLTLANSGHGDMRSQWEGKARALLLGKYQWTLSESNSLLLVSNLYDFTEGELIIRSTSSDKGLSGYELDMFRSLLLSNKWDDSFALLEKYGDSEPEMYRVALLSYTSSESIFRTIGEERFKFILDSIEKSEYMSLLEMIQTICTGSANVELGLLKPYIIKSVNRQRDDIEKDKQLVEAYSAKVKDLDAKIHNLENVPTIINKNGNSSSGGCEVCKGPVEFPMVFFKCGHQVHESCLIETVSSMGGCPQCQGFQEALEVGKKEASDEAVRSKVLLQGLGSKDRFKSMMGFLGRGGLSVKGSTRIE